MRAQARRFPVIGATVAAATLFCAGIVVVPLLEADGHGLAPWLRLAYAPLCHQLADRSAMLADHPLAVCARCTGLYTGGLVGLLLAVAVGWGARREAPRRRWLVLAVLPTAVDFLVDGLGNLSRMGVAIPAGVALGAFLGIGLNDLGRMMRRDRRSLEEAKPWTRASPTC